MPSRVVACLLAVAGSSAAVRADVLNWINAAGGSAAIPSNWNPGQIPDQNDALVWNIAGTYTVTFPLVANRSLTQTYRRGTVSLDVTSPHTISTNASEPGVVVGLQASDVATMRQISGEILCTEPVDLATLGSGTMVVDGDATVFEISVASGLLTVGRGGAGRLEISNGALLDTAGSVVVGNVGSATGTALIGPQAGVGERATLRTANDLDVGFSGAGTITIFDGGLVDVADRVRLGVNASGNGTVTIEGVAHRPSTLAVDGTMLVGSAGGGELNIESFGGVIVGNVLSIGGAGGSGVVNLDGGTLQALQVLIGSNGALNARGRINDPITNSGVINAIGTLAFGGNVTNDVLMSGAPMVFEGSLFTSGDVRAPVSFAANAPCVINGSCQIGDAGSGSGVAGDASVQINGHVVNFLDADEAEVGTVGGSGVARSVTGLVVADLISGDVEFEAPEVRGVLRVIPGAPASQDAGELAFSGHLELGVSAIVEIDIDTLGSDRIAADTLELNGARLQIRKMPGYVPVPGDSFSIIEASSITGPFTVELLPQGFRVSRFLGELRVVFECAADMDGNGQLNIFDFLGFQAAFGNQEPAGDFDGNGAFNIFDFLAFQAAFGNGC